MSIRLCDCWPILASRSHVAARLVRLQWQTRCNNRRADDDVRLRLCADLSISERRARKHDVGADSEPEGIIAHDRYLDEHAENRENYHNERSNKPKVHCAYLLGL